MKERNIFRILLLIICASMMSASYIQIASALIPSVVSITPWVSGTHTMLNITITHEPPPTIGPSHYVSTVELDINGTITDLTQSPQSTTTFVVTYDMGEVNETLAVQARAYCIVHGWGAWSSTITVPEYSVVTLLLLIGLVGVMLMTIRFRSRILTRFHSNRSVYNST